MILSEIIDAKSCVNYDQLKELIKTIALPAFIKQAQHPMLVGKDLYDGVVRRHPRAVPSETLEFAKVATSVGGKVRDRTGLGLDASADISQAVQVLKDKGWQAWRPSTSVVITRSIYVLRKRLTIEGDQNSFTIGRNAENDIIISDYVVSKSHAVITMNEGFYYIYDIGSTNGTKVDGIAVPRNTMQLIQPGSTISFGRLAFVFTHPLEVYRGVRKEAVGGA